MSKRSEFGLYSGEELFDLPNIPYETIIDLFLYRGDHCLIVGAEGIGKSIFTLQMAACLTSGTDFLDAFVIPKPLPILYVQTEGKMTETAKRLKCISRAIDIRRENFQLLYQPGMALDTRSGFEYLQAEIEQYMLNGGNAPQVVFIDPVYSAIVGSYNDDEVIRQFTRNMKILTDKYHASIVMNHHEHKEKRDYKGNIVLETGGQAMMGSRLLNMHIDQGFHLQRRIDKTRSITPWKDREANVTGPLQLVLIEPSPLLFAISGGGSGSYESVKWHVYDYERINSLGITMQELLKKTKLSRETVNKALRHYKDNGELRRANPGENPARFRMRR